MQDSSFTQSALLVWVCREEGRVEAAVAAGGEKSSHPLCQCRRIWADIFFFPTVESHPTSCMSQLTSSQDLSQSKSAIKPRDSSFSPFYICSFTPGRSLQWPGKHRKQVKFLSDSHTTAFGLVTESGKKNFHCSLSRDLNKSFPYQTDTGRFFSLKCPDH